MILISFAKMWIYFVYWALWTERKKKKKKRNGTCQTESNHAQHASQLIIKLDQADKLAYYQTAKT